MTKKSKYRKCEPPKEHWMDYPFCMKCGPRVGRHSGLQAIEWQGEHGLHKDWLCPECIKKEGI